MIAELLNHGETNSITGKELAIHFNCDIRDITARIERERREGKPICASASGGYFLAETPEELEIYCNRIHHRAGELYKTRRALLNVLGKMLEQKQQEQLETTK